MPFGFHLTMDTLPSGDLLLRPTTLVNAVSWIWRPSFERQRDFNPPEQRAAQRALPHCRLLANRVWGCECNGDLASTSRLCRNLNGFCPTFIRVKQDDYCFLTRFTARTVQVSQRICLRDDLSVLSLRSLAGGQDRLTQDEMRRRSILREQRQ